MNPQLARSANLHELMEADAAADERDGYDRSNVARGGSTDRCVRRARTVPTRRG